MFNDCRLWRRQLEFLVSNLIELNLNRYLSINQPISVGGCKTKLEVCLNNFKHVNYPECQSFWLAPSKYWEKEWKNWKIHENLQKEVVSKSIVMRS